KSCSNSFQVVGTSFNDDAGVSGSKKSSVVRKFVDPLQITLPSGQGTPEALPNVVGCWAVAGEGERITAKARARKHRVMPARKGWQHRERIIFVSYLRTGWKSPLAKKRHKCPAAPDGEGSSTFADAP